MDVMKDINLDVQSRLVCDVSHKETYLMWVLTETLIQLMLLTYLPAKAEKSQEASLLLWLSWKNESYYYPDTKARREKKPDVSYFICVGLKLFFKQHNLPHGTFEKEILGYLVSGIETRHSVESFPSCLAASVEFHSLQYPRCALA